MSENRAHFVYVLVAPEGGHFAEMAAVAATTLRRIMPQAQITFVMDEATAAQPAPAMTILRNLASGWIAEPVGDMSPGMASRLLKLSTRNLIDGDFVFLDCDTLVARDLMPLVNHRGEFAAVEDRPAMPDDIRSFAKEAGLFVPRRYFNSGVMGLRDTPATRAAFAAALENWKQHNETGLYFDQVFLNSAMHHSEAEIAWLPPTYNAQIWAKTYHAVKPHIFHIFTGNFADRDETVLHLLAKTLKQTGELDESVLAVFLESGNPWIRLSRPGQYIALGRPASAIASTFRLAFGGRGRSVA